MKNGNILIVDDDEEYLRLVECIAEEAGIKAHYATSGEEAVGILKEGCFTTLITDLNMSGMDGYELAMVAKELSPDIDIVMITGEISPDVSRLAAQAGISKVIAKPLRLAQIKKIVKGETKRHYDLIMPGDVNIQ